VHARHAIRLIGDLACIYQGTQDAPAGAYVIQFPARPRSGGSTAAAVRAGRASDGGQLQAPPDLSRRDASGPGPAGEPRRSDDRGAT
jgi:hypothetical protein